jgi:hypothetical protein
MVGSARMRVVRVGARAMIRCRMGGRSDRVAGRGIEEVGIGEGEGEGE